MEILKVDSSITISCIGDLREYHKSIKPLIDQRMHEFQAVGERGSSLDIFRELVFCILTANASARMGLNAINAIDDNTLIYGSEADISAELRGLYRFPISRANYIVRSRTFLNGFDLDLRKIFNEYSTKTVEGLHALRAYLTNSLIGIGYKECSHFLRNVGFKELAILDKHVISMLNLLGCNVQKPAKKSEYVTVELLMRTFAQRHDLDFDELDLVFWSYKTGEIIK